jgi:Dimethyladenosine transferase (rRNA methylation)
MAKLNLDYYSGNDLYSDGNVEEVILNIVKTGQEYTDYAGCDNYYPIMYHLSPERENILNWYPFKDSDVILEVGSGCGAITGLLCQKAKWVTSIELSKRRAEINFERHRTCDNLEIMVGNLNDMTLEKKYDYVILTGVFEYALSFTDSKEPYVTFLNTFKKYVTDDGRLLISIENRLGIKYFSGAMEDHTNEYYLGLMNYAENNTVRTFSKTELEGLFEACGMSHWKFYYPYPDYKFPTEIFTDENVNSDNYGRVYRNYQRGRVELFSELDMIQTFKKEKIMGSFSNSFLIEVSVDNAPSSNVVYAKLNNTRKKHFCISTIILRDSSGDKVRKEALHDEAVAHIHNVYANQSKELPLGFEYLQGSIQGKVVEYPYLQCENLDACMLRWIEERKAGEIQKKIDALHDTLLKASTTIEDIYCEQFREYFGDTQYAGSMQCIKECNIDLIFDNLYPDDKGYIVIDPEWVCPFWVPVKFIIWRMLNEWYAKYPSAEKILPGQTMFARYGITGELEEIFRKWAVYFATKYVSDIDLDRAAIQVQRLNMNHMVQRELQANTLCSSLYIDYGQGFSEKEKINISIELDEGKFWFKVALDCSKTIKALRWDPVEYRFCRCNIRNCYLDKQEVETIPNNSDQLDSSLFWNMDPQFTLNITSGRYAELEVCGMFEYLQDEFVKKKMDNVERHTTVLLAESGVLRDEAERVNGELAIATGELSTTKSELTTVRSELTTAQSELTTAQSELTMARSELSIIKNSREWRILNVWRKWRNA